eukprot:2809461-Prymnesium_polylepis.1
MGHRAFLRAGSRPHDYHTLMAIVYEPQLMKHGGHRGRGACRERQERLQARQQDSHTPPLRLSGKAGPRVRALRKDGASAPREDGARRWRQLPPRAHNRSDHLWPAPHLLRKLCVPQHFSHTAAANSEQRQRLHGA